MAETLLAILLVTSSAKGSSLVYQWPPKPAASPRLSRALPDDALSPSNLDNPWRASHLSDPLNKPLSVHVQVPESDPTYRWKRPEDAYRDRSLSFNGSMPPSGRSSPAKDGPYEIESRPIKDEYEHVFGYSSEFLAGILCPQQSMCHQKFELTVDDLAFLGHPVCAEVDGVWRFKPEKVKPGARGRESRNRQSSQNNNDATSSESPDRASQTDNSASAWLQTFHFVLVLDLPDPSSSASGNISKYFDVIYEQIAFPITAVLFQQQVVSNFVEVECDNLGTLKDSYISRGEPFLDYVSQALEVSSVAPAMKALYLAIKSHSMAYLTIHNIPLELQLPPHLDFLLHSEEENEIDFVTHPDDDESQAWGPELSFGWMLPALAPWKSLLLLDIQDGLDPYMNLRGPHSPEDRTVVEGLIRFLETASVTLSLAEMSSLLDWDIDAQVYPAVRWLVLHRRAKVVDIVHGGLKTVFTLPPKFHQSLGQLTSDFEKEFSHPSIPSLPQILSTISTSSSQQSGNHFFACVVRSKELIPMYHDVVLWMLKRDMLITLHLRVRVIVTHDLKLQVRLDREKALARKNKAQDGGGPLNGEHNQQEGDPHGVSWMSLSPKSARRYTRRVPSNDSEHSRLSELIIPDDDDGELEDFSESVEEDLDEDSGWETAEDNLWPSMINDPSRATPLQRRWLSAMSDGKDPYIARRFEQINQYFDGKKTDDEILFRADITRKQLREVLHHYEEYLQTFLHPS